MDFCIQNLTDFAKISPSYFCKNDSLERQASYINAMCVFLLNLAGGVSLSPALFEGV